MEPHNIVSRKRLDENLRDRGLAVKECVGLTDTIAPCCGKPETAELRLKSI